MSIQFTETDRWEKQRHPRNHGIIIVTCRDDFIAAARDPSCFYAILKVDEESKNADRAAYKLMWDEWQDKSRQSEFRFEKGDYFVNNKGCYTNCSHQHIGRQLKQQAEMLLEIRRQAQLIHLDVLPNFRCDGLNHDTHQHSVIARVFFAQGTFIPLINPEDFPDSIADYSKLGPDDFLQVDEGDFLYIAPHRPHWPEFETNKNKEADRLTISALPIAPMC